VNSVQCELTLSQEIFNISMAEIESKVKPYGVANDVWWGAIFDQ